MSRVRLNGGLATIFWGLCSPGPSVEPPVIIIAYLSHALDSIILLYIDVYLCRIGSRNLWDSDTDNCDHHLYFNVSTDADTQTVLLIRAVVHLEVEKGADPATHCEIQNVVYLTPAHGKMLTALHPNLWS